MKTFSERKGFKPVSETIQIDSMNEALRNSLWNALDAERVNDIETPGDINLVSKGRIFS